MGRYHPIAIFEKEPVAIAAAIRSVLFVLVLMNIAELSVEQLAGIAIGLELVLGLFARGASTANVNVAATKPSESATTTTTVTEVDGTPGARG